MTSIGQLDGCLLSEVHIQGWVHAIRMQKRMAFLVIKDATGRTQCVVDRRTQPELANVVASLTRESVVGVSGTVVAGPDPGAIEIQAQAVVIYSRSTPSPPIDPASLDQPGVETWMDWRYLDLRRPANRLIFEIQTEIEWAMRQHWKEHAFIEIHTPKLMATASESGVELFEVGYFGEKAYLAQSPQFYKQMAMASGFDRVFEIAPVSRAKNLETCIAEFKSAGLMKLQNQSLKKVFSWQLQEKAGVITMVVSLLSGVVAVIGSNTVLLILSGRRTISRRK